MNNIYFLKIKTDFIEHKLYLDKSSERYRLWWASM